MSEIMRNVNDFVEKAKVPAAVVMAGVTVEMVKGASALYDLVDKMPAGEVIRGAAHAVSTLPDQDKTLLAAGCAAAVTAGVVGAKIVFDSPVFPKRWREEIYTSFPILGRSPEQKAMDKTSDAFAKARQEEIDKKREEDALDRLRQGV